MLNAGLASLTNDRISGGELVGLKNIKRYSAEDLRDSFSQRLSELFHASRRSNNFRRIFCFYNYLE